MKKFSKLARKLITQYKSFAETTDVLSSEHNNVWSFIEEFGSMEVFHELHSYIKENRDELVKIDPMMKEHLFTLDGALTTKNTNGIFKGISEISKILVQKLDDDVVNYGFYFFDENDSIVSDKEIGLFLKGLSLSQQNDLLTFGGMNDLLTFGGMDEPRIVKEKIMLMNGYNGSKAKVEKSTLEEIHKFISKHNKNVLKGLDFLYEDLLEINIYSK